jgi:acetyltransferase
MLTANVRMQRTFILRDGRRVFARRCVPGDERALTELLHTMSSRSRALRFGTAGVDVAASAAWAVRHPGVIALDGDGAAIGHAWFVQTGRDRGELAIVVREDAQGRGLGTQLLGMLAGLAETQGIATLEAFVFPHNRHMQELLETCGLPVWRRGADFAGVTFELATRVDATAVA